MISTYFSISFLKTFLASPSTYHPQIQSGYHSPSNALLKSVLQIGTLFVVWPSLSLKVSQFKSLFPQEVVPDSSQLKILHCSYIFSMFLQFYYGIYYSMSFIESAYLFYFLRIPGRQKPYHFTSIIPTGTYS